MAKRRTRTYVLGILVFFSITMIILEYLDSRNNSQFEGWYNHTMLEAIREDCGQLCNTSRKGTPGKFFNHIHTSIDCEALFMNPYIDRGHQLSEAPRHIPKSLKQDFTMNGQIRLRELYLQDHYYDKKAKTSKWTEAFINDWMLQAKNGTLEGTYGIKETNALRDGLKHARIKNGRILVIGSERPWVEACLLEAGAKEIVTLEYGSIYSEHPKVKTLLPAEFRSLYLNRSLGNFDAVVTFSSVEHSGLGRYGDALNPWGDIIAIARSWCVTRNGGSLTIGVMYDYNNDLLRFNADRWYGKIRYPYLTTNWKQVYRGHGNQRVHVFTK